MKIWPVTGIEVFESAGALGKEVQVPSRQRGIEQHARHLIPTSTGHQRSEAVLSPHSSSCGRPRARTQNEQSQASFSAVPKPKLVSVGSSQRKWRIILAKAKHKRDCEFRHISKHVTRVLRHKGCQEADGAEQWANALSLLKDAEHTQDWKKARWIDVLGRSTDKPRMEYCEEQLGTIRYIRALQGHSHGVAINPNLFSSKQVPFVWKEHLFHRTVLPTANQSWRNGPCAGGLKS